MHACDRHQRYMTKIHKSVKQEELDRASREVFESISERLVVAMETITTEVDGLQDVYVVASPTSPLQKVTVQTPVPVYQTRYCTMHSCFNFSNYHDHLSVPRHRQDIYYTHANYITHMLIRILFYTS